MKKILMTAVAAVSLLVGCRSDKDKAEELIRKELNKVIVNFDTYESIETVIDSAFTPYSTAEKRSIKMPANTINKLFLFFNVHNVRFL